MERHVYKEWRLECGQCHQITKQMAWDYDDLPTMCTCGGPLVEEELLRRVGGVIPDDIPGGLIMDHVEPGRRVDSRSELKKVLASHGYNLSEGWAGPNDKYLTRWH